MLLPSEVSLDIDSALPVTLAERMPVWLCGHPQALQLCRDLLFIAARWDDLIDKDTPLMDSDIHELMQVSLSLPLNPFYIQHFAALHTLLQNSIRNWKVAVAIERDPAHTETNLMTAFILRSSYVDIIAHMAMILKDVPHAEAVAREVHHFMQREGFQTYLRALKREDEVRNNGMRHR